MIKLFRHLKCEHNIESSGNSEIAGSDFRREGFLAIKKLSKELKLCWNSFRESLVHGFLARAAIMRLQISF